MIPSLCVYFLPCLGRDVIAQAQSGTGKTATFSIAILEKMKVDWTECQALVLAPTRELAQQVCTLFLCFLSVINTLTLT